MDERVGRQTGLFWLIHQTASLPAQCPAQHTISTHYAGASLHVQQPTFGLEVVGRPGGPLAGTGGTSFPSGTMAGRLQQAIDQP